MIVGLDTNVVIRYIVQDHPEQSKRANRCIESWIKQGKALRICQIALSEIYWVLERCYKLSKPELISVLSALLQTKQIQIEQDNVVWQALRDFENSSVGFSDCLIGRQNASCECSATFTFDKEATKQLTTFTLVP